MPPTSDSPLGLCPSTVRTHTVLFAVSANERRSFLGEALPDLGDNVVLRHLADEDLVPEKWSALLQAINPTIIVACWRTPPIPADFVDSPYCALQYVCYLAGSVKHLVPRAFLEQGRLVTNWGDLVSWAVAEHGILLGLAALRNLGAWPQVIANSADIPSPANFLQTRVLRGKRVGIHGYGAIARCLIELLKPFGASVSVYAGGVAPKVIARTGVGAPSSLEDLFGSSDVLFECEALRPDTTGIVNACLLALLPDSAVFVNIARGKLVDEKALLQEARSGRIRVALDVVKVEPLNNASPFVEMGTPVLSPHIGGPTADQYPLCGRHALDNIQRYLRGEPAIGAVTLEQYDRST